MMTRWQVFQTLMEIPKGAKLFLTEDGKKELLNLVDVRRIDESEKIEKIG